MRRTREQIAVTEAMRGMAQLIFKVDEETAEQIISLMDKLYKTFQAGEFIASPQSSESAKEG